VAGIDGEGGTLGELPRAVMIGPLNDVSAVVIAPNGTLEIGAGTRARGAFFARDVVVGPGAEIEGYPVDPPGPCQLFELCKSMNLNGTIVVTCTTTPVPDGTSCANETLCDGAEVCLGGRCAAGTPLTVDDGLPCSLDYCDPKAGVLHQPLPAGSSCSDGNDCTRNDQCTTGAGSCVGTTLADGESCSDGDLCNGEEKCVQGSCQGGAPKLLDDLDPRTIDACDPTTGKVSHADCLSALDLTVATNLARAATCLYAGADPLQIGIAGQPFEPSLFDPFAEGAPFDATRLSLLRGEARDAKGTALSGVKISVLEQPQAGSTVTRSDGVFNMVIDGGANVTVTYAKPGYLPVHSRGRHDGRPARGRSIADRAGRADEARLFILPGANAVAHSHSAFFRMGF
jgi:hypothetical protein